MGGCFSKAPKSSVGLAEIEHFDQNPLAHDIAKFFMPYDDIWEDRPNHAPLNVSFEERPDEIIAKAVKIRDKVIELMADPSTALCDSECDGHIESMHDIYKNIILKPGLFSDVFNLDTNSRGGGGNIFYQPTQDMIEKKEAPWHYMISALKEHYGTLNYHAIAQVFSEVQFESLDMIKWVCDPLSSSEPQKPMSEIFALVLSKCLKVLGEDLVALELFSACIKGLSQNMAYDEAGRDILSHLFECLKSLSDDFAIELLKQKIGVVLCSSSYNDPQNHEVMALDSEHAQVIVDFVIDNNNLFPIDFRLKCNYDPLLVERVAGFNDDLERLLLNEAEYTGRASFALMNTPFQAGTDGDDDLPSIGEASESHDSFLD